MRVDALRRRPGFSAAGDVEETAAAFPLGPPEMFPAPLGVPARLVPRLAGVTGGESVVEAAAFPLRLTDMLLPAR